MKYFIGLDAHSSTSTFAVLNEIGECVLRKTVDTSEKNLWNVIESINGERILTSQKNLELKLTSGMPFILPMNFGVGT